MIPLDKLGIAFVFNVIMTGGPHKVTTTTAEFIMKYICYAQIPFQNTWVNYTTRESYLEIVNEWVNRVGCVVFIECNFIIREVNERSFVCICEIQDANAARIPRWCFIH